jgi:hypothetical protein
LAKFNFPERSIDILKHLCIGATSTVYVNGFLTGSIDIKNSVRQGCPLSMILFVLLYIEPLTREMSAEVSGANVGIETIKVLGYADNIIFVVQNDEESDQVFAAVDWFCTESNARLSLSKSVFLRVKNCKLVPQVIKEVETRKILGFFFM